MSKAAELAAGLIECTIDMELPNGEYSQGADNVIEREDGSASFVLYWPENVHSQKTERYEVIVRKMGPSENIR